MQLTPLPEGAAAALVAAAARWSVAPPGVNAGRATAEAVAVAWHRLYRHGELTPPQPAPARAATPADRALLRRWFAAFAAFAADIGQPPPRDDRALDERIAQGRCTLWEDGKHPVSMAGITPTLSGTARVAPVHTPPERRGRGYAGAATAALSAAARASDVTGLLLFTALANPTSNALYQRIGYRVVEDHVVIQFGTERAGGAEDAEGTRGVVEAQPSRGEGRLPTSAQPPVHPNGCRQLAVAGVLS